MNYSKLRKTLGLLASQALGIVLTLAAPAALATRAFANVDQVQQVAGQIAITDTKIGGVATASGNGSAVSTTTTMMDLYYSGTATAAYVTIGVSSVAFYAPFNVPDTSIGYADWGATGGVFDTSVSSVSTLGQLCDLINTQGLSSGLPKWHCTLTGGIRSDPVAYLPNVVEVSGTNNVAALGGYLVPVSTTQVMSIGIIPAQGRHVILNYAVVNSSLSTGGSAQNVQVFGVQAKFGALVNQFGTALNDSTLAWVQGAPLVSNTATVLPLATAIPSPWLEFANPGGAGGNAYSVKVAPVGGLQYNGHVVVRLNDYASGSANQTSSNYIQANWTEK